MGDKTVSANIPYLYNNISFKISEQAVDDIFNYKPVGWPTTKKDIQALLVGLTD